MVQVSYSFYSQEGIEVLGVPAVFGLGPPGYLADDFFHSLPRAVWALRGREEIRESGISLIESIGLAELVPPVSNGAWVLSEICYRIFLNLFRAIKYCVASGRGAARPDRDEVTCSFGRDALRRVRSLR